MRHHHPHDKVRDLEPSDSLWADPEFDISRQNLSRLYGSLDTNRDGYITRNQLKRGIRRFVRTAVQEEDLEQLVAEVDFDGRDVITKDQFIKVIQDIVVRARFFGSHPFLEQELRECFVFDYSANKYDFRCTPTFNPEDLVKEPAGPAGKYDVRWIHVSGRHLPTLLLIANHYGLNALEIEDALEADERSRVVRHSDGHLQIMLRAVKAKKKPPLRLKDEQMAIFVMNNQTVISVQENITPFLTYRLQRRIAQKGSKLRHHGAHYLVYALIDRIVDHASAQLNPFNREIMKIEQESRDSQRPMHSHVLKDLHRIAREMHSLSGWISPLQNIIPQLAKYAPDLTEGYSDVLDHTYFITDKVSYIHSWTSTLSQRYTDAQNAHMNEVMYTLTMVTATFVPLQFITGIYGMNFEHMPELDDEYSYLWFWVACLVILILLFILFKRKRWI